MEVRDRVADRVGLQVADVGLAARIGKHLEHVGLGRPRREARRPGTRVRARLGAALVRDLPRTLALPDGLPAWLDLLGLIAALWHPEPQVSGRSVRNPAVG